MIKYDWVLFDADETLFSFDAYQGLRQLFAKYQRDFSQEDYIKYQQLNKPLWTAYQNGQISAEDVQQQRFQPWAEQLQVKAADLNQEFLQAMAVVCAPLPGACELVRALRSSRKLGIITNGFTNLQQLRLERSGLQECFEFIVTSEQVGVAKPDPAIFAYAFTRMGEPHPSRVLMVGDTLESDIKGGNLAGIDTCWLNWHQQTGHDISATYQVANLQQLHALLISD